MFTLSVIYSYVPIIMKISMNPSKIKENEKSLQTGTKIAKPTCPKLLSRQKESKKQKGIFY